MTEAFKMKYVVLGGGAVGSIIGGHLTKAGEDLTVLARGARAAHLREHGIAISGLANASPVHCATVCDLDYPIQPTGRSESILPIDDPRRTAKWHPGDCGG